MVEFDGLGHSARHPHRGRAAGRRGVRHAREGRPDHRERARARMGGIGDIYNAFIPSLTLGLRLVRPQLRVEQRLRGEPAQHQADRPAQQQPAVVQGAGEDLLRAERHPLPRRHARRAPRDDRDRRDHDAARASSTASSTCCGRRDEPVALQIIDDVEPEPTVADGPDAAPPRCASSGPDTIIALGGGSPMDAAKVMWLLYEHPEVEFADMREKFFDIRKRAFTFPDARRAWPSWSASPRPRAPARR